ncbi:hypothetical protein BACPU_26030 [Bacillus pumilus]|nr:hypothetical protein BACPU_26030 [Bacillus pumilus]
MREIRQLSNSALDRFSQCPRSYYFQYLDPARPKQVGTETFYADFGLLMHFLVEFYPRMLKGNDFPFTPAKDPKPHDMQGLLNCYGNQLMEKREELDVEKMLMLYDSAFPLIPFPSIEKRDEYYAQGKTYIENIPNMDWSKLVGLEVEFKIDIQNQTRPIKGFIDKLERDDKGLVVTDYKTSKPYSPAATMRKDQLPIYGMACFLLYGELPYKYRYDFVRFGKVVEVEIPIERLTTVSNNIKFKYIQMSTYRITNKFPAIYQDFYCKNFCGFTHLCSKFQEYND